MQNANYSLQEEKTVFAAVRESFLVRELHLVQTHFNFAQILQTWWQTSWKRTFLFNVIIFRVGGKNTGQSAEIPTKAIEAFEVTVHACFETAYVFIMSWLVVYADLI